MKIRARPCARCSSRSRFRYWAWMVRSRLVVGSSAMSRRGSQEMPMAPTMRWRMPPDISCGYCSRRVCGEGMRTDFSSSHARLHALARPAPSCTRIGSATWSPIVNSGFSEAMGSCRIMAMRLPRTRRISASDFCSRSSPSNSILPLAMRAAGGSRRRMVSASVLLPEPDSPTIAQRLAGIDAQRDLVDGAHDPRAPRRDVVGGEIVELEQRAGAHRATRCAGTAPKGLLRWRLRADAAGDRV